ncbi:MAG: SagB/ThcOx family dehydrogenase [Bryobacterales bacterium]|nr:SagB/ThcOx family dehydrogenase [Bryobacterales bacterium]
MKLPSPNAQPLVSSALRGLRAKSAPSVRTALPAPSLEGTVPLETCLRQRRSVRDYTEQPLSLQQASQLLWAAMGATNPAGLRTAPSAGAVFPVRAYVMAANVEGLTAGFYSYDVDRHDLSLLARGDKRRRLEKAAADQQCVGQSALLVVLTGYYRRLLREFGEGSQRLAAMEAGHIGQNFSLQATALGLGSIGLGKFDPTSLKMLLPIPQDEEPLYLLLAGCV